MGREVQDPKECYFLFLFRKADFIEKKRVFASS